MKRSRFLPAGLLLLVSGCATLSEDECRTADWRAIGFEDGAAGQPLERFSAHREACAAHGVTADLAAWRRGRDEGLLHYCTDRRGFDEALRGGRYHGVCPGALEPAFLDGWRAGRALYDADAVIAELERELRASGRELDHLDAELADREQALIEAELSVEQRRALYAEIEALKQERMLLLRRDDELADELDRARARLWRLRERYERYLLPGQ